MWETKCGKNRFEESLSMDVFGGVWCVEGGTWQMEREEWPKCVESKEDTFKNGSKNSHVSFYDSVSRLVRCIFRSLV